ncbi:MAG TPA: penicillin-binding transpeptidase domain-containing protein, partial [Steroidobacteraceae bacterium]|nr:penicillin-binding transpeptidase domain-containing protein [Steroidobacteraceae bacterium]
TYGIVTGDNDNTRFCGGVYRAYGRQWRDFEPKGHGYVNLRRAIEESCDVYFFGVGDALGIERIHDFLEPFGFGRTVGLDIGGEKIGILPSSEWKRKAFKRPEDQKWYPGETVNVGIGQGYLTVTPLQLAYGVSAIATRGKRFEPRLVKAIRDSATNKVSEIPPRPLPSIELKDPSYWQVVIDGMTAVTQGAHGTARGTGMTAQYVFAGKTGTAQVISVSAHENIKAVTKTLSERERDHAWFIAFAPVAEPRIAVAVIVENGGQGGRAAAPVARRIMDTYLLSPEALKEQDSKGKSPGISATDIAGSE